MRGKRVALVVHPLHIHGGAEYNLKVISDLFPDATIFTAWCDEEFVKQRFEGRKIRTSFMQHLPNMKKLHQEYTPLLPTAYRLFKFDGFERVVILSDGFEKNIYVKKGTRVLLDVLTPPRFLWMESRSIQNSRKITYNLYNKFLKQLLHSKWRELDKRAAMRADVVLGISKDVQARIARFYGIHSEVLYPPVETKDIQFNPILGSRKDWYLYFGRIETYKGVELAIRTAIAYGHQLKIAGTGTQEQAMRELITELGGDELIEIIGYVSEEQKQELLLECKALIYPVKDEDFGIVPIEANASGCPVVAFRGGGVKETVLENVSGVFFDEFTKESLNEAIEKLDRAGIDPQKCFNQAQNFKREIYESKLMTFVNNL